MKKNNALAGLAALLALLSAVNLPAAIIGNPLVERQYATDFPAGPEPYNVLVINANTLPTAHLDAFLTYNQGSPGGSPSASAGHLFDGYILRPLGGSDYQVVFDTGLLTVPNTPVDSIISYPVSFNLLAGDIFGHFGGGIPVDTETGTDKLYFPTVTSAPVLNQIVTLGSSDFPLFPQARTYSIAVSVVPDGGLTLSLLGFALVGVEGLRRKLRK